MDSEAETTPRTEQIRELNDQLRRCGRGNGSVVLTSGVQSLGDAFLAAVVRAVCEFDDFSEDNDPWGEHDFGAIEVEGQKIFFKIDYYDLSRTKGSEDPADGLLTHRVLTIMLSSEY
ncbi:DUF3768 domain-containing protein [Jannaschia sp. KMU-145]|uniref:DUF3768 domain-containing protein n=1 Tax=Jannaschia halovivens TaxID=3388667 RepID=UPI00396B2114